MEKPEKFDESYIVKEKVKALNAIRQYSSEEALENFVRGQYIAGRFDGEDYLGYREEDSVAADSRTETFA
ncbi:glucose-6-phosphate dehydrogenase, partial [Mycobacterium kansasii]